MFRYLMLMCLLLIVTYIYLNTIGNQTKKSSRLNSIELVLYENITYQSNGFLGKKKDHAKNVHVPKFMLELYENNKYNNYTSVPEVVRSIIPKRADVVDGYFEQFGEYQDNHLLIFDVPNSSDDEVFLWAELKILTLVDEQNSNLLRGVQRLVKLSVYDETTKNYLFVDKLTLSNTNKTWITFNLTDTVHDILKKSNVSRCLKVVISIKHYMEFIENKSKTFRLSLMPMKENIEHDYPILLLSYDITANEQKTRTSKRLKRNVEEDYEEETNKIWDDDLSKKEYLKRLKKSRNACKRKPLYVNFSDINYDSWIVQPRGYEAYQCQGKCFYPVAEHLSPTKHAIVQALLHSLSPAKTARSCCVPTKLTSISILYVDHNGVLTYRLAYQDMVVTECGCR